VIAPIERKKVVFAGGGTGGHLFPALAVARALHGLDPVFVVPDDRGDEQRLAGEFPCLVMRCPRPDRDRWLSPARLARAIRDARRTLRRLHAAAVVGLGAYASVPFALAARSLGLPLYLMELNAVPGRATRLLARFATGVGLGQPDALEAMRWRGACRVTGTPLRAELSRPARRAEFGLREDLPTLAVLGGSQGSQGLNARVVDGLVRCGDLPIQVLHCAGARDAYRVRGSYLAVDLPSRVIDFTPDIGRVYAVADLVISRAGASTVAECLALGKPAVYVPYPWHRDRQQERNARAAEAAGAARVVEEHELTPRALRGLLTSILLEPEQRGRMAAAARALGRPDAAQQMAAHLVETIGNSLAEPVWMAELGG